MTCHLFSNLGFLLVQHSPVRGEPDRSFPELKGTGQAIRFCGGVPVVLCNSKIAHNPRRNVSDASEPLVGSGKGVPAELPIALASLQR